MVVGRRAMWDDLEAFRVAAVELNFTRAAQRLHLTQPALSRRIQRLEAQLGAALFERTTRRVTLTEAGHRLLAGSADLDAAWGRVQTEIAAAQASTDDQDDPSAQSRSVALPTHVRVSAASLAVVRLLEALTNAYPDTVWHHEPFDHTSSLNAVGTGDLDIAIPFHPLHDDPTRSSVPQMALTRHPAIRHLGLPALHLVDEPVWVATGPHTPWADHAELTLTQLAAETWITRPEGPLRHLFDDACRHAGFTAKSLRIVDNNWPIRSLVAAGQAVTLCAATVIGEDITVVPLRNAPRLRYSMTWSPQHLTADQARHVHHTIKTWYRTEAQRSRRYWAHILSHPTLFAALLSLDPPVR
jgi:DNA-binding transcriptional LysR family regulator